MRWSTSCVPRPLLLDRILTLRLQIDGRQFSHRNKPVDLARSGVLKMYGLNHLRGNKKMLKPAIELLLDEHNFFKDGELQVSLTRVDVRSF